MFLQGENPDPVTLVISVWGTDIPIGKCVLGNMFPGETHITVTPYSVFYQLLRKGSYFYEALTCFDCDFFAPRNVTLPEKAVITNGRRYT